MNKNLPLAKRYPDLPIPRHRVTKLLGNEGQSYPVRKTYRPELNWQERWHQQTGIKPNE